MLTIRLSRVGKPKQPTYRLVVVPKTSDPWGRSLEILGHYNPRTKAATLKVERIKYWLSKGAAASATVYNLLVNQKIIEGKKTSPVSISQKRRAKMAEKAKSASVAAPAPALAPAA